MVVNASLIAVLAGGTVAAAIFIGSGARDAEPEPALQAPSPQENSIAASVDNGGKKKTSPPKTAKAPAQQLEQNRKRWEQKKAALDKALEGADASLKAAGNLDTRKEYSRLIQACVRDIEDGPAKFSIKLTEVGAPDIGTIVTHAEVVRASVKLAETITCAEQSMYAYVGPAPKEAYEKTYRFGMMMPKPGAEKVGEKGLESLIHYEMDRHYEEVRACEPETIKGYVELEVVVGEKGATQKVTVIDSSVSKSVSGCIRTAAKQWRYVRLMKGTHRHRFELPVKDQVVAR